MRPVLASLVVAASVLGGCALPGGGQPSRPAPLLHLVLFQLQDPAQLHQLRVDCDRLLTTIPSVTSYAVGRHVDIGRDNVVADYDLALRVGFEDVVGYRAYLDHPAHLELLEIWGQRLQGVVIYDVGN